MKLNQEMEEALHATEEPPPLTDYTLEQEAMVQEIRNKTYLIKYQGGFSRHSLLDKDVTEPQTCKTLNTRYCEYCRVEIDLHVWVDHIRSLYHILQGKVHRQLSFRCWRGQRFEKPHDWIVCTQCKLRCGKLKDYGPAFHDAETYVSSQDLDTLDALRADTSRKECGPSKGDTFFCDLCKVRCHSLDYYTNHINGQKHRTRVEASQSPSKTPSSRKRKAPTDSHTPQNKRPKGPSVTAPTTETDTQQRDPTYCEVCDIHLKDKKNMARHKRTVRHRNNQKARLTAQGEDLEEPTTANAELNERGFAVTGSEKHPGKNFFITIQSAAKYKVAKHLTRRMYQCLDCLRRFRSSGFLRRHRSDPVHKFISQRRKLNNVEKKWKRILERLIFHDVHDFRASRITRIREARERQMNRVKMAVICNEFTPATATDPFPLSHCHAYLVTKEKMLFSKVKTYFRQRLHTRIADIL